MSDDVDPDENRFTGWLQDREAGGTADVVTHVVDVQADVRLSLALPPWIDPQDALERVLEALGNHDLGYRVLESWSYGDPEFEIICRDGDDITGTVATITPVHEEDS